MITKIINNATTTNDNNKSSGQDWWNEGGIKLNQWILHFVSPGST